MNYLAHIHLAHVTNTSMLGNFFGDFVKGSNLSHLSDEHQLGVKLHRKIDSFTDGHEHVVALRELFPRSVRRMSGIVIDIYFDHLLCAHWSQFTKPELEHILDRFYTEVQQHPDDVSERFQQVRRGLLNYRWLSDYQEAKNCKRSFEQIEKRLNKRIMFADEAAEFIVEHDAELRERFLSFYPELIDFSHAKAIELA
jgi:acyl carrier protein phosphodiesterase